MGKTITKAMDMAWRARPMGQALIVALLVAALSSTIALFMTPSVFTLT